MEEMKLQEPPPPQFLSPCSGGRFLAPWKSSQGPLAPGQGKQENGLGLFYRDDFQLAGKTGFAHSSV